jgi:septum formation protein
VIRFPHILLASKSPRRHQILRETGFQFTYIDIDADEDFPNYLKKQEVCEFLATHKASHYQGEYNSSVLVTADTIVCVGDEIINKPADRDEAFSMLQKLSGRMHEVFTAVCLKTEDKTLVFSERSEVYFHQLSSTEIYHYIDTCKPFDKAGAYGVQDWMGFVGVQKINGCFYNVMGFPMARFYREFQQFLIPQ